MNPTPRKPNAPTSPAEAGQSAATTALASTATDAYTPPRLQPLGRWQLVTLQQSVPIGPGG